MATIGDNPTSLEKCWVMRPVTHVCASVAACFDVNREVKV
jgi:hypothetical protein